MKKINVTILLLAMMTALTAHAAKTPGSEKEIPVYAGAVEDKARTEEMKNNEGQTPFGDLSLKSSHIKAYTVKASPEDVLRFYIKQLAAKEETNREVDPFALKPGTASYVGYTVGFHEESFFEDKFDADNNLIISGKQMKALLAKNRKPYKPDQWVSHGFFGWEKKDANGDLTLIWISLDDSSFSDGYKYNTKTEFAVSSTTYMNKEQAQEIEDNKSDEVIKKKTKELEAKQPTGKDLDVPLYPGAKFNADATAGMSAENSENYYVYMSTDSPEKVKAFYEKKLKKKAMDGGNSMYMIALKGELPIPEEGLSIQPNTMFGGSAKTVITIMRKK